MFCINMANVDNYAHLYRSTYVLIETKKTTHLLLNCNFAFISVLVLILRQTQVCTGLSVGATIILPIAVKSRGLKEI